jgi:hypothetical protein
LIFLLCCYTFCGTNAAICWILYKKVHLNIALSKKQSCCFVMDLTFFLKLLSSLRVQNQIDLPALLLLYTLWYLCCNLLNLMQKVHASINLSKQSWYFAIMHTFVLQLTPSWQVLNKVDVVALLLCLLLHLTSICLIMNWIAPLLLSKCFFALKQHFSIEVLHKLFKSCCFVAIAWIDFYFKMLELFF